MNLWTNILTDCKDVKCDECVWMYEMSEFVMNLVICNVSLETLRADFFNAVYFRRGLTCTLGLTKDLIDGGQRMAKPCLYVKRSKITVERLFLALGLPASTKFSHWLTRYYMLDLV